MSVAAPFDTDARLRGLLVERWARQRRDALVFSTLTLALTPLFVGLALGVAVLLLPFVGMSPMRWMDGRHVPALAIAFVLLCLGVAVVARHDPRRGPLPWGAIGLACALWLAMLALALASGLAAAWPWLFWPSYLALALAVVAALLRAYEPPESYYLGWLAGGMDDPFTLDDDRDRGVVVFGFIGAVVGLIVDAYEPILRSAWLLAPLRAGELGAAAGRLAALTVVRAASADALGLGDRAADARALRLLERLGVVRVERDRLRITDAGRELLVAARRRPGV